MTYESEIAKSVSYQFECKKDALRQTQDGGVKVTFSIQPNDMPGELYGDAMGQRYMAVIVPLNDDESPREKAKSFAGQAKMLSQEGAFLDYIVTSYNLHKCPPTEAGHAEVFLENYCGVKSCSELVEGSEAGRKFKRLQADYLRWRDS